MFLNINKNRRGSILLWVLVFSSIMVTIFFYYSLRVKSQFRRQKNLLEFIETKEHLERLVDSSLNSLKGSFGRDGVAFKVSRYVSAIDGELNGSNALAYHFTDEEKELENNFDTLSDFQLYFNSCDLDIGVDEKGRILVSVLSYRKGDDIKNAVLHQAELLPDPFSVCIPDDNEWKDERDLSSVLDPAIVFNPVENNYILILDSIDQPLHFCVEGIGANEIPDRYVYSKGEITLENGQFLSAAAQKEEYEEIEIPDKFKHLLAERGWE